MESSRRDRRDVGEPPVFVVSVREPSFAKAGKRILAQLPQPWQVMAGGKLLELGEAFQVIFKLLSCRDHVVLPWFSFSLGGSSMPRLGFHSAIALFFNRQPHFWASPPHHPPI